MSRSDGGHAADKSIEDIVLPELPDGPGPGSLPRFAPDHLCSCGLRQGDVEVVDWRQHIGHTPNPATTTNLLVTEVGR